MKRAQYAAFGPITGPSDHISGGGCPRYTNFLMGSETAGMATAGQSAMPEPVWSEPAGGA